METETFCSPHKSEWVPALNGTMKCDNDKCENQVELVPITLDVRPSSGQQISKLVASLFLSEGD